MWTSSSTSSSGAACPTSSARGKHEKRWVHSVRTTCRYHYTLTCTAVSLHVVVWLFSCLVVCVTCIICFRCLFVCAPVSMSALFQPPPPPLHLLSPFHGPPCCCRDFSAVPVTRPFSSSCGFFFGLAAVLDILYYDTHCCP